MFDYDSLKALVAVVRAGSFESAAQMLDVTQSAVSQRIKQLEERMGTVLIVRGRPCVASEDGMALCQHYEQVELLQQEVTRRFSGGTDRPSAKVRIAVNADSLATWFPHVIKQAAEDLAVLIEAIPDDQEFTQERLRTGEALATITSSADQIPGCNVIKLGEMHYHAVASPEYTKTFLRDGVSLASVANAPSIRFDHKDSLPLQWLEKVFGEKAHLTSHFVPSYEGHLISCGNGIGWAIMPGVTVAPLIAEKRLVELVPGQTIAVPLFWHSKSSSGDTMAQLTKIVQAVADGGLNA